MTDFNRSLGWARLHCNFEHATSVSRHPWGVVSALSTTESVHFLKRTAPTNAKTAMLYDLFAQTCADNVPSLLSSRPDRGWYLYADHRGERLSRDDAKDRSDLLATFGAIQAAVQSRIQGWNGPRAGKGTETADALLDFLTRPAVDPELGHGWSAANILSAATLERLAGAFSGRASTLREFFERMAPLPEVLEHGDLRHANAARRPDGTIVLFDWDDSLVAPAGYSLHAQFSGCARIYRALRAAPRLLEDADSRIARDRTLLDRWAKPLFAGELLNDRLLQHAVPAAAAAGVAAYVVSFTAHPLGSSSSQKAIASNIEKRLLDLLATLDLYEAAMRKAASPAQPSARTPVAKTSNETGDLPKITFTDVERDGGTVEPARIEEAAALYTEHGTLVLENAFSPALIEGVRKAYFEQYRSYFSSASHDDTLRVGDKRFMVTLTMKPPFDDPRLFGAPTVLPVMRRLLSRDCILGSYTCVTSLPGSKDQRMHKDHSALFPEADGLATPPFATTMIVPLVELTEMTGTTRLVKDSHRASSKAAKDMPFVDPYLKPGSCFLMDFRLSHQGLANRSERPRPIMSMVYQRPWFRDYLNYDNQKPVDLGPLDVGSLRSRHRKLLQWAERERG